MHSRLLESLSVDFKSVLHRGWSEASPARRLSPPEPGSQEGRGDVVPGGGRRHGETQPPDAGGSSPLVWPGAGTTTPVRSASMTCAVSCRNMCGMTTPLMNSITTSQVSFEVIFLNRHDYAPIRLLCITRVGVTHDIDDMRLLLLGASCALVRR